MQAYLDVLKKTLDFDWENAKEKQANYLSDKIKGKMADKQLFIGILTKKYCEILSEKLKVGIINKKSLSGNEADFCFNASDWIIQESGYAIGIGMRTLFIIEKGVREPEGLHKDAEHIYFERKFEEKSFTDLQEAIGSLFEKIALNAPKVIEPTESLESCFEESTEDTDEDRGDKYKKLFELIRSNGDEAEVRKIEGEILDTCLDDVSRQNNKSIILHFKSLIGNTNVLSELKELRKEAPENPMVLSTLAEVLENFKNYEEAAEIYIQASAFRDEYGKVSLLSCASLALAKNGQKDEALYILSDLLTETLENESETKVYASLAETARFLKLDDSFVIFAEKALVLDPENDNLRFWLAHKYGGMDENELSLFHYRILIQNNPIGSNYNNLGVAYSNLEFKGKSVSSYKKAAEEKSGIAMSNLAQIYIRQGFIDEANSILLEAQQCDNDDDDRKCIHKAQVDVDNLIKKESDKEKEILEKLDSKRRFLLKYAIPFSIPFKVEKRLDGQWSTDKYGIFDLTTDSAGKIYARSEICEKVDTPTSLGTLFSTTKETIKTRIIELNGQITNKSVRFKISSKIKGESQGILSFDKYASKGYGIINENFREVEVMQDDSNKGVNFTVFKKL